MNEPHLPKKNLFPQQTPAQEKASQAEEPPDQTPDPTMPLSFFGSRADAGELGKSGTLLADASSAIPDEGNECLTDAQTMSLISEATRHKTLSEVAGEEDTSSSEQTIPLFSSTSTTEKTLRDSSGGNSSESEQAVSLFSDSSDGEKTALSPSVALENSSSVGHPMPVFLKANDTENTFVEPPLEAGQGTASDANYQTVAASLHLHSEGVCLEDHAGLQPIEQVPSAVRHSGKYEVLREIGRGGMGRILLYRDRNLGRVVAAKLALAQKAEAEQAVQRFLEEGQITGQLEHPNIVPVHEMGLDEAKNPYFTMKYVKGQSLKALLERLKREPALVGESWSLSKILQMFQSVCYAIDYAHSKGVIHRDLKPENIMLGDFSEVLVMDWGLAKVIGRGQEIFCEDAVTTLRSDGGFKTLDGQIAGTPMYMAPEQAAGDLSLMDARSDIYSLGAILYEMLSGERTVETGGLLEILTRVASGRIRPLPSKGIFGPVPRELRSIVQKALQLAPQNRYPSARELAEDIQRFIDGREVHACIYSIVDKTKRLLKRYRRESLLVAVTLLILLPLFIGWNHLQQRKIYDGYLNSAARQVQEAEKMKNDLQKLLQGSQKSLDRYNCQREEEAAKKSFEVVRSSILKAVEAYRSAFGITPSYSLKTAEATAWLSLFDTARSTQNQSWMDTAHQQIKAALTPDDYQRQYREYLEGYSALSLTSDPSARATFFRFEEADKEARQHWFRLLPIPYDGQTHRVIPEIAQELQKASLDDLNDQDTLLDKLAQDPRVSHEQTPLQKKLREGSYLILLESPGYQPMRLLVQLSRGKDAQLQGRLLKENKVSSDFVYLPQTRFLMGGETIGAGATRWETAGPVLLQKREVNFEEYMIFLQEVLEATQQFAPFLRTLVEQKRRLEPGQNLDEFVASWLKIIEHPLSPAERAAFWQEPAAPLPSLELSGTKRGKFFDLILPKTFEGRILIYNKELRIVAAENWAKGKEKWKQWPVSGVTKVGCDLYVLWRSAKEGRRYRLPTEAEWELAARGADGRQFSWGRIFWPKAAKLNAGYGIVDFKPGDEFGRSSADVSPWGVLDLGGSLGEWVSSPFIPEAKEIKYTIKGNVWALTPEGMKCAFRAPESDRYFHPTLGFRIAMEVEDEFFQ